ncbi:MULTISPECIES: response regulator transcription factor [Alteromonas]|uniref:Response regulator n=1 Tax=Alteromonas hispanica TaxID=315421 RepID=A0A6L9MY46_9ALTE|nr:response regulator transcription factor [Alteromonas sp. MB-3u-76]AUC87925.1 DNA-binding response regulator [Alteromonas sp. MB-3u-76]MAI65772.1 DNA-binding response regulator [Alteromonas sp.]NDW23142.1 response regulator [Alteromonas hispanica]
MPTRILIADDHPLFRAAMCHALSSGSGAELVEASTFPETMNMLAQDTTIDVVFLDLGMPGSEGLNGLSEVRAEYPDVLVVIVTAQDSPGIVQRALALGASGFIPKSASVDCIVDAVNTVLEGETWLPAHIDLSADGNDSLDDFGARLSQLTPHQLKVLRMVADGLLNKQIAYELAISESTVKQHVSAVLKKLGVINRTKAGIAFKNAMRTE